MWNVICIIDDNIDTHIKHIKESKRNIRSLVPYLKAAKNSDLTNFEISEICNEIKTTCKGNSKIHILENNNNFIIVGKDHHAQNRIHDFLQTLPEAINGLINIQWKRMNTNPGKCVIACTHEGIAMRTTAYLEKEHIQYIKSIHISSQRPNIHILDSLNTNQVEVIKKLEGTYIWHNENTKGVITSMHLQNIGNCIRTKLNRIQAIKIKPIRRILNKIWPNTKVLSKEQTRNITTELPFLKILYPDTIIIPKTKLCNTHFSILHMNVGKNRKRMNNIIKKLKISPSLILQNETAAPEHLIENIEGYKLLANINAKLENNKYCYGSCTHIDKTIEHITENITPQYNQNNEDEILWTKINFKKQLVLHICHIYS
jgi:hypothetical protein